MKELNIATLSMVTGGITCRAEQFIGCDDPTKKSIRP